jgi:hypothetical protein
VILRAFRGSEVAGFTVSDYAGFLLRCIAHSAHFFRAPGSCWPRSIAWPKKNRIRPAKVANLTDSPILEIVRQQKSLEIWDQQGRSKVVAAFGRKPLNFRIPSGLAATLEQPWFGALQFTPWGSKEPGWRLGRTV